ncbi:Mss4-like protein [Xylaria sp. CBS 124048]|nr:Mss4-like protein [Xylaria sp. CBS 124048]
MLRVSFVLPRTPRVSWFFCKQATPPPSIRSRPPIKSPPQSSNRLSFHAMTSKRETRQDRKARLERGDPKDRQDGNDWAHRPPYRTANENDDFEKRHTAHCHCGRVKYWLSREKPLATKFCHCTDCQALHGAPFQWAAIFNKEDLHFENGVEGLAFYHSPTKTTEHELPVKVSCAYCHSPIMDEGRNMVLMFPGIIKFENAEDKKLFDPQCHIFYSQRVVDLHDGKPKYVGLDKDGELMKETSVDEAETVVGKREIETETEDK